MGSAVPDLIQTFLAVGALTLAGGSVFPLSEWFGDITAFAMFACFLLGASVRWRLDSLRRALVISGFVALTSMSLIVRAPVPRLALLAWVFLCVFWGERSSGGKWRGRGGHVLILALAGFGYAGFLAMYSRSPMMWFTLRRLSVLSYIGGLLAPVTLAKLSLVYALVILTVSLLIVLAARAFKPREKHGRRLAYVCLPLSLLLMLHPVARERHPAGPPDGSRLRRNGAILLYSQGLLDWELPSPERLGLMNSGMFGLFRRSLERYAEARGGAVSEVDSLSPETLSGARMVVFINPTRDLGRRETESLHRFMASGGGLLVLGDHTDIGGSRNPLNHVLQCTSIRFNFDSAICLRKLWRGGLEVRDHPVTRGIRDEIDVQLGTGASLDISPPAFPIIASQWAFSDLGDYENCGHGAFMGNGRHDSGEAVGHLVLVAGEEVGSGRVLVFGDTSPFQNGAHFLSQRLIANSVRWVCAEGAGGGNDAIYGAGDLSGADISCTGVLGIRPFEAVAAIDFGLNPDAARSLFTEASLGAMANCFYRVGITPFQLCARGDWPWDSSGTEAAFIVLVAPTRRLGQGVTCRLMDYMYSGGRLIIAKGHSSPEPCAGLLGGLGFEIEPVPLGSGEGAKPLCHRSAWGISYSGPPDTLLHAEAFGWPTAVTKRVGKGSLTLIGDARLLADEGLERETAAVPENVAFVTALIDDLREDSLEVIAADHVLAGNHSH